MTDNMKIVEDWASRPDVAADDIGGVKYLRHKLTLGADGQNDGDVSQNNPCPVSETGSDFVNITSSTTTNVKSGAGILKSVSVNQAGVGSTITIYDNTAGSGTKIATINSVSEKTVPFGCQFNTGLTVVTTGATPANITVIYQ